MLKPSSNPPPAAAPTVTLSLRNVRRDTPRFPLASGEDVAPFCASSNPCDISDSLRRMLDCNADAVVRAAAADVAGHGCVDVSIGRIGVACNQRRRRHDLARLAVAALHHVQLAPRLLHLLARGCVADCFNRSDLLVADSRRRQYARAHRDAVEMNGAGAALSDTAAEL